MKGKINKWRWILLSGEEARLDNLHIFSFRLLTACLFVMLLDESRSRSELNRLLSSTISSKNIGAASDAEVHQRRGSVGGGNKACPLGVCRSLESILVVDGGLFRSHVSPVSSTRRLPLGHESTASSSRERKWWCSDVPIWPGSQRAVMRAGVVWFTHSPPIRRMGKRQKGGSSSLPKAH